MSMAAHAQDWLEDYNRSKAIGDFLSKFRVVLKENPKYAVMNYPITYYDIYAITGEYTNPKNVGIDEVVMMPDNEQKEIAKKASLLYVNASTKVSKLKTEVARPIQLSKAIQHRINIQSEGGPYTYATKGFYLSIPYESYLSLTGLKKKVYEKLSSQNPDNSGIFDIDVTNAFSPGTITVTPAK